MNILFENKFRYFKNSFFTESGLDIIPEGQCHLNKGVYDLSFSLNSPLIKSLGKILTSKYNKSLGK